MKLVRAVALKGYPELVGELGGDVSRLLGRFRIPEAIFEQPQEFLPYIDVIRLLEDSARHLRCPDFGLRLAERQDIGILGPLAVAMQNSATVGEALACASRYIVVHSPAIGFFPRPAERAGRVLVVFELRLDHPAPAVQVIELSLALTTRVLSILSDDRCRPLEVRLPHRPVGTHEGYLRHLSARVRFGCDCAALEVREADLALPIERHNSELREMAEEYLELRYANAESSFSGRIHGIVRRSLGTGASACVDVARALALHPRTLQRRLSGEGTTFEKIKDSARAELATEYLERLDMPLSQVAALLDYSEQSALTRSSRRWFGRSPRAVRCELMRREEG